MERVFLFNGDADGLCAMHQWRLAHPGPARLVSGPKREINLLKQIPIQTPADLWVFDVSLEVNRPWLVPLLAAGCRITWFDHHHPGVLPSHPGLTPYIHTHSQLCTSLIVDQLLGGRYRPWAVAAAFGDNLPEAARQAAETLNLSAKQLSDLRELGEWLNYNGYGETLEDLLFSPIELAQAMEAYSDPWAFRRQDPRVEALRKAYLEDMRHGEQMTPVWEGRGGRVFRLPGEAWARRMVGVWANHLSQKQPTLAHAVALPNTDGTLRVSVRAPLFSPQGAGELCGRFPSGGGREGAGGVNQLPESQWKAFLEAFQGVYERGPGQTD
ncbi:MAG: acetyltransferase [Deltaproteobacteria bacterium]|nr:acetyltransferase [Deltaproteobacteria bacterium]